jgi:naphthalene 1,2-dioxygenase ferredoxin component
MTQEARNWITVARRPDLAEGGVLGVTAGGHDIAIYDIGGEIFATDNVCTHAHAYLSDGWLEGDVIECPLHGGRFEARTGKGLGAPITCDLRAFQVRLVGDEIQVRLEG